MAIHTVKVPVWLSWPLMLFIGCCLPPAALAQGVGSGAKARMQEMDRRELQLSDVGRGKHRETDPRRARAIMDQVNEDFQRLLKLHNQIVRDVTHNNPTDFQFISDATGEIRRRAIRLQSTLGLPKPETAEPKPEGQASEGQPTKDDLIALCRKVESFILNPIIETPGTVDAQQLERARRDLESVVELSGAISKRAEKQKH